jgi:hypothetical protein
MYTDLDFEIVFHKIIEENWNKIFAKQVIKRILIPMTKAQTKSSN